jgi:hypothetical protein
VSFHAEEVRELRRSVPLGVRHWFAGAAVALAAVGCALVVNGEGAAVLAFSGAVVLGASATRTRHVRPIWFVVAEVMFLWTVVLALSWNGASVLTALGAVVCLVMGLPTFRLVIALVLLALVTALIAWNVIAIDGLGMLAVAWIACAVVLAGLAAAALLRRFKLSARARERAPVKIE